MNIKMQDRRQTKGGEEMAVPVHPGYVFRVGIVHHPDAGPQVDPEKVVYLELPATPDQFLAAEEELGDPGWLGTVFASIESIVPSVDDMLYTTEDLPELNQLAEKLADLTSEELLMYEVILKTEHCRDLQDAGLLADGIKRSDSPESNQVQEGKKWSLCGEGCSLAEIFHIYASQGRDNYTELDLPTSDYEMLDLMDRLRLEPGQLPYVEVLKIREEYDYLSKCLPELPNIYQLNALAQKLSEFTSVLDMAAFEGMVGVEMQKGSVLIEIPKLIDFAHSTEYCHVAENAMTDHQLGKFLVDNDFIADAIDLPDAALALLDYGKIGREHREQTKGVYTGFGYVEAYGDMRRVSETMDFQPQKPAYTILVNMAAMPLTGSVIQKEDMFQLRLPASEGEIQAALEKLGRKDLNDVAVSVWDSPLPWLKHTIYFGEELPQLLELAERLQKLDAAGEMPKYKAILEIEDGQSLFLMLSFAEKMDKYLFRPQASSPADVAQEKLKVLMGDEDAETLMPYIDLQGYGRALLERDHAVITEYGLVERAGGEQVQSMEEQPGPGGMEMM